MKKVILLFSALFFVAAAYGQTETFQPTFNIVKNFSLSVNSFALSPSNNQFNNINTFNCQFNHSDENMPNRNNPYLMPLQMVDNSSQWCPQQSFQSAYFVDKVMFKTYKIGNLKMHANYVYDMQGNLRSTSTSFGD